MKPPFVRDPNESYRPPKSRRELERRRKRQQGGEQYMTILDRMFYALLTALMYAFVGFLLDGAVTLIRSVMDMGNGSIFWLFTPFLAILGTIIGFFTGKSAGADSMDVLRNPDDTVAFDDYSIRHDIFRGIGFGILFFFVVWIIVLIVL